MEKGRFKLNDTIIFVQKVPNSYSSIYEYKYCITNVNNEWGYFRYDLRDMNKVDIFGAANPNYQNILEGISEEALGSYNVSIVEDIEDD